MTSNNIEKVQIIAHIDDGTHLMAVSDDRVLIECIVAWCKFAKLKEELFAECSLKEITE